MSRTDRAIPRKLCSGCPFCTPPERAPRERTAFELELAAEENDMEWFDANRRKA